LVKQGELLVDSEPVERRLAAILAADVVGYSRLMEANEERTLGALKAHLREFFDPTIARHNGRIFKVMGDGFLVEFASVLDAIRSAVDIQRGMPERNVGTPEDRHIRFRIGINMGDVIIDGDDVFGDGVNLAARLEALAWPGGIACSATVREQAGNQLELEFLDQGEQTLKNIKRPIRVYIVDLAQVAPDLAVDGPAKAPARGSLDKPSVAVLPFGNMSNDPEQEFFSDGITEDIITDLSQASGLFVIARNTVFTYKGAAVDVEQVSKRLGVSHVLEGSVRKVGQRVRVNAQLLDGATGGHVWAERFDRELTDIFELQDEITRKIVDALKVQLLPEERSAIKKAPTGNIEAYTYHLRGREFLNRHMKRYYLLARQMFAKAAELDPAYAGAYAGIAICDTYLHRGGDSTISIDEVLTNSAKAMDLDPGLAEAHVSRGFALGSFERHQDAEVEFKAALDLDPMLPEANYFYGDYCLALGRYERAAELFERAAELQPEDFHSLSMLSNSYEALERQGAAETANRHAAERAERVFQSQPENATAAVFAALTLARQGAKARAKTLLELALATESNDPSIDYNAACAFARLGDKERAMAHLERAFPIILFHKTWVREDPDLAPLHDLPMFQALLEKLDTAST
jgi:adenylate cyclase